MSRADEVLMCDRCGEEVRYGKAKYCKRCHKEVLAEMKENGYLTSAPRFAGAWSGVTRTQEMRENTRETKMGRDG